MAMENFAQIFEHELLGESTEVMRQYLAHFENDAREFAGKITTAAKVWEQFSTAAKHEESRPDLLWSTTYFYGAINSTLISTRLFLSGYIVPSGNQARHALESMAFSVLLAFPRTGVYQEWKKGRDIEYKALTSLAKHARHCGNVNKKNIAALNEIAKHFDQYSIRVVCLLPPFGSQVKRTA